MAVEVADTPGALQAVADCLGRNHINLANCSGFVAHNRAILILEVHELANPPSAPSRGPKPHLSRGDAQALIEKRSGLRQASGQ